MHSKTVLILVLAVLWNANLWAQKSTTEIGLVTDNDLYTSSKNDMYYTNGLEIFHRHLVKNTNDSIEKRTIEFKLGQYIYTPRFLDSKDESGIDRPFAGYLFGEVGSNVFYKNESVLKANLQLGYVGPNSFGRETQKSFHKLVGYKAVSGWEYQIKNALAVQTQFFYSKKIFQTKESTKIDFHFQSEANLGTIFTGVSTGFLTRIGLKKLVPVYNSNLHGASLGSVATEFYFYIAPSVNYQLYDATIQGSLFSSNSPVTFSLVPFRFNGEAGFKYRKNNLNLSYVFVYRGKELYSKTISGYFYGSIGLSYLLK
ncbi:lipid A deacylase LpxR family protein [Flavobacterium muglaense]|uniref:Lipid A deacylase LpxR family protein n=1 Tax=Flavobacterium muglaense TaxID=2764716 RepID=A0A923N3U6_9FLAO|nr:lipid A deacylase LpxR family protein [Flavobacterium muglaense]MBC5839554.1 lipid A deacylase LpxR family protein [Flavobacterium muglaense]MBC5846079.1 lipid A deacylase LpxR family protein [Flavobacterium muglaense]